MTLMKRPATSDADEWQLYLQDGLQGQPDTACAFLAVQIVEAIEEHQRALATEVYRLAEDAAMRFSDLASEDTPSGHFHRGSIHEAKSIARAINAIMPYARSPSPRDQASSAMLGSAAGAAPLLEVRNWARHEEPKEGRWFLLPVGASDTRVPTATIDHSRDGHKQTRLDAESDARRLALAWNCLGALEEIAKQELSLDMSVDDQLGGDFEGAYNHLIEIARKALASIETEENG